MKLRTKYRLIFASGLASVFLIATGLFVQDASPIVHWVRNHEGLTIAVVAPLIPITLGAVGIATIASNSAHQPSDAAFYIADFGLWFVVCYTFSIPLFRGKEYEG